MALAFCIEDLLCVFNQHLHLLLRIEPTCYKPTDGSLATSLAEDVLTLMETQRSVLRHFVDENDCPETIFEEGMLFVLECLKDHQLRHRPLYLITLTDTCAAANNFLRMSERMEVLVRDFSSNPLQTAGQALVYQYSQDAVLAAERAQIFIFRHVQQQTNIPRDLFHATWEDDYTHNEVVAGLLEVTDKFLVDIEGYIANQYLYDKTLLITARGLICFYIRCLLQKAEGIARTRRRPREFIQDKRNLPFRSPKRALRRMTDDIVMIRGFFESRTKTNVPLFRMIRSELNTLELIHDVLFATYEDPASIECFIVVLHKRTGADILVTRHFVSDLWLLVASQDHRSLREVAHALRTMQPDLQMVSSRMKERATGTELSFARLDEMLKVMYEDRLVQGLLPVCWTCLPKDLVKDGDDAVVAQGIRKITRGVVELGLGKRKTSSG